MRLLFLRHGQTAGNQLRRYIGRTDEPLCDDGICALKERRDEMMALLGQLKGDGALIPCFVSPLLRCRQSARVLFNAGEQEDTMVEMRIREGLRECDFGLFENRNYLELSEDPATREVYQAWVDSGGWAPFPEGEDLAGFQERTCKAFLSCIGELHPRQGAVFVVHGGTIMSIFDRYAAESTPPKAYYAWGVANGCGYTAELMPDEKGDLHLTQICPVGGE